MQYDYPRITIRDATNDFHIPWCTVESGFQLEQSVSESFLLKSQENILVSEKLTTDESARKQQKVKSDSLDLGGSPSNYQESVIKIMEKPMIPLSQRQ